LLTGGVLFDTITSHNISSLILKKQASPFLQMSNFSNTTTAGLSLQLEGWGSRNAHVGGDPLVIVAGSWLAS
jgi:hypothetical protein